MCILDICAAKVFDLILVERAVIIEQGNDKQYYFFFKNINLKVVYVSERGRFYKS